MKCLSFAPRIVDTNKLKLYAREEFQSYQFPLMDEIFLRKSCGVDSRIHSRTRIESNSCSVFNRPSSISLTR